MNHDFDDFVKQHLQDILCQFEKEHTLEMMRKTRIHRHKSVNHAQHHSIHTHEVQVQDCAISPSLSHSHL